MSLRHELGLDTPIGAAAFECSMLCTLGEGHEITADKLRFFLDCLMLEQEDVAYIQSILEVVERTGKPFDTCCGWLDD